MPLILIVVVVVGAFFAGNKLVESQNKPVVVEKQATSPTSVSDSDEDTIQCVVGGGKPFKTLRWKCKTYQEQWQTNRQVNQQPQVVQKTSATIDCVGPDGKHFRTTQTECDDFNNAWKNPKQNSNPWGQSVGSPQTSSSSQPLVTCVLSYGTYQLTQSSCDSFKSSDKQTSSLIDCFVYSPCTGQSNTYRVNQDICDYFHRSTNSSCDYLNSLKKLEEISNRRLELTPVQINFPTPVPLKIIQEPTPTCYPVMFPNGAWGFSCD